MRFQGQNLGLVAGSLPDGKSVILRLPHGDLSKAPRLGDLVLVKDEATNSQWLARVESQSHVSIELHEQEVRNAIARGLTSLGSMLSDHEKEMYLGHDYQLKLLGEIRNGFKFAPVVRIMPPRGAVVNHLKADELKRLVTLDDTGANIGYYAVGDEINEANSNEIPVKFSIRRFVSRRSAIFGVAGFGKSNLMKNILAELTVKEPTVGKIVFDLDGEYSFGAGEGQKKRYGLADIPAVAERLVVYTNASRDDAVYKTVIEGQPVLNLGELSPRKVVSALLPESRQDRVYAELLRGLTPDKWKALLGLVSANGYDTDPKTVASVLGLNHDDFLPSIQGVIRALVPITKGHAAGSNLMKDTLDNLAMGATIVIDLSSMGLDAAYNVTSFMVDEIFEANQTAFVAGGKVPEIIVFVEEAQNLLSDKQVREGNPISRLAKEGRKYNLGLVYVSQQPGAIAKEILTQTNTYFVMHLLSKIDVRALQDINPHYEGIIADFIQMESLQGHAYVYSSVPDMPIQSYVFATKATSFNATVETLNKQPATGERALKRLQAEMFGALADCLKKILVAERYTSTAEGERKYKSPPISAALCKQVPEQYDFVKDRRRPEFVNNEWLVRICEHLGFEARVAWEDTYYLYLKDKQQGIPQVTRSAARG